MKFINLWMMIYGTKPQSLKIKGLTSPIQNFWCSRQENYQRNGFFDVNGNIFIKKANTSFQKIYPNISNLNFFGDYDNYKLVSYESQNDYYKKSLVLWFDGCEEFHWSNTTLIEYMNKDEYRRIDFFGNVFYKNIPENLTLYNSFSLIQNEFFQKISCLDNYTFSINNFNLFYIHDINCPKRIRILYSECLPTFHPIKKLEIKSFSNFYHCLLWNSKNEVYLYIFVKLENEFKLINRNYLQTTEKNIIDIVFDNGYLFLGLHNKIVIYNYSTIEKKMTKITERRFELPYYTEMFLDDNLIYFNNQKCVCYIKIDTNYYKTSHHLILPSSS